MKTPICKALGIDVPIFAFTHCRDVVVEVSKAGGIGVLGAIGFSADQLREELDWIDAHIGDHVYGVDIVIPEKYEGKGEDDPVKLLAQLEAMMPQGHRDFVHNLLAEYGVPELPEEEQTAGLQGWTMATVRPLLDEALKRPKVTLIANALGTPPADVIAEVKDSGRLIGALCGRVKHAIKHREAGLDFIIAQGSEGGGHAGDIGSIVLWPAVIEAAGSVPVLAAGGIGTGAQIAAALALGAQGVWTGSLWVPVLEAMAGPKEKEALLAAGYEDTVRSRAYSGKPGRMLKNAWTDAWEVEGAPKPLPMPLQGMVTTDAMLRTKRYADVGRTQEVSVNPIGQTIGFIHSEETCRGVMQRLLEEYVEAMEKAVALYQGEE
jgi:NAD(P)H-dependent flavin oxidoreductase YrpB (nitropropane dioxygenase family)